MISDKSRVLSIDPTSTGLSFAVLEGPERLIDWGALRVPSLSEDEYLTKIEGLLNRCRPQILVLEDPRGLGSRRGPRIVKLTREIELLAWRRRLSVERVSRAEIQALYKDSGNTKQEIAEAIARWFTELEMSLPRPRQAWESEDQRMNVFDAVSFALTVFRTRSQTGGIPK